MNALYCLHDLFQFITDLHRLIKTERCFHWKEIPMWSK